MTHQQLLERAGAEIGALAAGAGIRPIAMAVDLAGVGAEMLPSLLGHELIAGHAVMMRVVGKVEYFLNLIAADRSPEDQDRGCRQVVQLSAAAARLTERYRLGLMSLARLERWAGAGAARRPGSRRAADAVDPADDFDDDPLDDGPGGGTRKSPAKILAELAALEKSMGAMVDKAQANGAKPNGQDSGARSQSVPNRGRLRHGNPSGDVLAARRCGARTRAGCACRQPAMRNGRCRLHGGKSTGARTEAGLARCRTASLVHGQRSAEIIDLKSAAARHGRRLRALTQAARVAMAEPQSERATPCPASVSLARESKILRGIGESRRCKLAPSAFIPSYLRSSAINPSPATAPDPRFERATPCPATRPAGRRAVG